ncbi:MAG: hypothetical protein EP332_05785 [Bacteroidetes bacterium]|nr:MAG: hypothetical protein EP332_05785 [Bacteroidota bacterium]
MSLKYYLIPFPLAKDKKSFRAVPKHERSLGTEDLINRMLDRGTSVTKVDIKAVFELLNQVVTQELLHGNRIQTPLFSAQLRIEGTFNEPAELFDSNKHKIHVSLTASPALERQIKEIRPQRCKNTGQHALIQMCTNLCRNLIHQAQPGDILEIKGQYFYLMPKILLKVSTSKTRQAIPSWIKSSPSNLPPF